MSNPASAIKEAEAALDKGDYTFCIKIIDPLLISFSSETAIGSQLRLLKVTACMGKGDEQQAINICQLLVNNKEATVRQQAKQLLSILDAPSLPRPSNWSVEIPKIEIEPSLVSTFRKASKKKQKKTNHPPTGPTKNLDFGFSIITVLIISFIAFLLSGCVNISTNLSVTGPDRLNISLDIDSISGNSIPWQREFSDNLTKENSVLTVETEGGQQHFRSPTIRFDEANELLQQISLVASATSGFELKGPQMILNNKNLLIGSRQNLKIYFDLENLPKIPGLKINLTLSNINNKNNLRTTPLTPIFKNGSMWLPLEIGQINQLEVSYWKWNKISIGIILIVFLTLMSLILQKLRLNMGLGFPELPP